MIKNKIGQNIKTARERVGMTRSRLGSETGLHVTRIRKYEEDRAPQSLAILEKIASALACTVAELVGDGVSMPAPLTPRMDIHLYIHDGDAIPLAGGPNVPNPTQFGATSPTTDPGMAQDEGHNQAVSAARDMGDQGGVGGVK